MTFRVAKEAADILITSPGEKKRFLLYGGEPLLSFGIIEKAVNYAEKKARALNKKLSIAIATNGLLFKKQHLIFFKQHGIKVCISIAGNRKLHDRYRIFANGRGTFSTLSEKIDMVFENINRNDVCALFCIHPQHAQYAFRSFLYLVKKGFQNINMECIYNVAWPKDSKEAFINNFSKIGSFILGQIKLRNFIFLNSLSKSLNDGKHFRKNSCLFSGNCVEVYPDGKLSFYPYITRHHMSVLGSARSGFGGIYATCSFNVSSKRCRRCAEDYYFKLPSLRGREIFHIRNMLSNELASSVNLLGKKAPVFKEYVREAKKRIFA